MTTTSIAMPRGNPVARRYSPASRAGEASLEATALLMSARDALALALARVDGALAQMRGEVNPYIDRQRRTA